MPRYVKNVTIVALEGGKLVASHSLLGPGTPKKLTLTIDAPSPMTGTGNKLLLDGHDAALLRASVVDNEGRLVPAALETVTFEIVSGPGRVVGIGNGDPALHRHQAGVTTETYGGLARGVVQSSADCVSKGVATALEVDADPAAGKRTQLLPVLDIWEGKCTPVPIVVRVHSDLGEAIVSIPTSVDASVDSPAAVASQTVHLDTFTYLEDFQG